MSEFGGFWKRKIYQHALVSPKTKCGCPSGGGIKNGYIRYPSYGGTQKEKKIHIPPSRIGVNLGEMKLNEPGRQKKLGR